MPKCTFSPIEYYSKLNFLSQLEISFTAIERPSVLSISILVRKKKNVLGMTLCNSCLDCEQLCEQPGELYEGVNIFLFTVDIIVIFTSSISKRHLKRLLGLMK